jgi:50S ribosomal protein L16 3-hydroxylase
VKASFLAGLSPHGFLRRHWQKKPLLARGAMSECSGIVSYRDVTGLAQREDVESRLITREHGRWSVRHGPFTRRDVGRLPATGWTLLVQGVDEALPRARELLRRFAFIPYARLDDLMVSYAAPGGGVGPHYDSYDVFLIQGEGTRRWAVSGQTDLALVRDAPLKILRRFRPEHVWDVQPGDVLYLPPRHAHDGVAVTPCITYSVGFRAPSAQELATRFLEFMQDRVALEGMYEDPDLRPTARPARIDERMIERAARTLDRLAWSRADVREFIGRYLSEPKPHVRYSPPATPLRPSEFERRAARRGVRLAPATRMLFSGRRLYINGEAQSVGKAAAAVLSRLADARELQPAEKLDAEARRLVYEWYRAGYIELHGADFPPPAAKAGPRLRSPRRR